jgi:tetratricopeptide (TPR) repeat protein
MTLSPLQKGSATMKTLRCRLPLWLLLAWLCAAHAEGAEAGKATAPAAATATATNDPVEAAYQQLLEADDQAHEEIDQWILEADQFEKAGAGVLKANLEARIRQRLDAVDKSYRNFLDLHPKHARAHLAYGSFRNDIRDEDAAVEHWEKARELEPSNPAAWNNLANYYGHRSPVTNAFAYYAKAIELDPKEPVYVWNFATTVFLFRVDAMSFYGIDEAAVFEKALALYRQAVALDPTNFVLATDYANSFYVTKPARYEDGIVAWNQALKVAADDAEREGVRIHLARCHLGLKRFDEAAAQLALVTNEAYAPLKKRLAERIVQERAAQSAGTNAPPTAPSETKP